MIQVHFFDAGNMDWSRHPRFPDIRFKALATRESHPSARFSLVRLQAEGVIDTHVHQEEIETAYVLAGEGTLTVGNEQASLKSGMGVTIPAGLAHSLRNTGQTEMELFAVHVTDGS